MCLSTAIAAVKISDLVRECFASLRGDDMRTCCGGGVGRVCRDVDWWTRAEQSKPMINDGDGVKAQ
jgi:hypothetical protein